jgi:hypothetical protein
MTAKWAACVAAATFITSPSVDDHSPLGSRKNVSVVSISVNGPSLANIHRWYSLTQCAAKPWAFAEALADSVHELYKACSDVHQRWPPPPIRPRESRKVAASSGLSDLIASHAIL